MKYIIIIEPLCLLCENRGHNMKIFLNASTYEYNIVFLLIVVTSLLTPLWMGTGVLYSSRPDVQGLYCSLSQEYLS